VKSVRPVVLDACALIPMPLADTLLRLAAGPRLFLPKWSDQVMAEITRLFRRTLVSLLKKPWIARAKSDDIELHCSKPNGFPLPMHIVFRFDYCEVWLHGRASSEVKFDPTLPIAQLLLTITGKRRNLNLFRCRATGPSYRYGQLSPALHKSKSSGLP
jgi:hypothetical protein